MWLKKIRSGKDKNYLFEISGSLVVNEFLLPTCEKFLKLLFFKPQQKTNQNKPLDHLFHDLMLRK